MVVGEGEGSCGLWWNEGKETREWVGSGKLLMSREREREEGFWSSVGEWG